MHTGRVRSIWDGDGLADEEEVQLGTDPMKGDTDGDSYPDGLEKALGSDPLDKESTPDIRPPAFLNGPLLDVETITIFKEQADLTGQPAEEVKHVLQRSKGQHAQAGCSCWFYQFFGGKLSHGQPFTSGSTGKDGKLDLTTPGRIIFDPVALGLNPAISNVFNFTTINIGPGVTVVLTAKIFPAPVYWLAQGAVTISGVIDLSGENGHDETDLVTETGSRSRGGGRLFRWRGWKCFYPCNGWKRARRESSCHERSSKCREFPMMAYSPAASILFL